MRAASPMVADVNDRSRWASFDRGDLITDGYLALQRDLHARPNGYGGKGSKWADVVRGLIDRFDCTSVLDYGCGQGTLMRHLRENKPHRLRLAEFDVAIDGKDFMPTFADLVVCTDVLEHAEPEKLDRVIGHLGFLARKAVFAVVATRPANKTLADGRNAHLIQQSGQWWVDRFIQAGFAVEANAEASHRELVAVLT